MVNGQISVGAAAENWPGCFSHVGANVRTSAVDKIGVADIKAFSRLFAGSNMHMWMETVRTTCGY